VQLVRAGFEQRADGSHVQKPLMNVSAVFIGKLRRNLTPSHGSKPARIPRIAERCVNRAEFFALPTSHHHHSVLGSGLQHEIEIREAALARITNIQ
jgi:hypothetical protein